MPENGGTCTKNGSGNSERKWKTKGEQAWIPLRGEHGRVSPGIRYANLCLAGEIDGVAMFELLAIILSYSMSSPP